MPTERNTAIALASEVFDDLRLAALAARELRFRRSYDRPGIGAARAVSIPGPTQNRRAVLNPHVLLR